MKKLESGRSLVEMLGVLAIIGVLSIGGIAGYTMAMNRYRANEVLNAAQMLSVVAQSTRDGGTVPTLETIGVAGASGSTIHNCELSAEAGNPAVTAEGDNCDLTTIANITGATHTGGVIINANGQLGVAAGAGGE
jgi:type II secretory pathway pseudopilin PulG